MSSPMLVQFGLNPSKVIGVNPTSPVLQSKPLTSKFGMWKLIPAGDAFSLLQPETNLYLGVNRMRSAILLEEADAYDVTVKIQNVGPHPEGGDAVRIADAATGLTLTFEDQEIFRLIKSAPADNVAAPRVSPLSLPRPQEMVDVTAPPKLHASFSPLLTRCPKNHELLFTQTNRPYTCDVCDRFGNANAIPTYCCESCDIDVCHLCAKRSDLSTVLPQRIAIRDMTDALRAGVVEAPPSAAVAASTPSVGAQPATLVPEREAPPAQAAPAPAPAPPSVSPSFPAAAAPASSEDTNAVEDGIPVSARCCNGHLLTITMKPKNAWQTVPYDRYTCASCGQSSLSARDPAAHCSLCAYDLCGSCLPAALDAEASRQAAEVKAAEVPYAVEPAHEPKLVLENASTSAGIADVNALRPPFVPPLPVVLARSAEPTPRGEHDVQIASPLPQSHGMAMIPEPPKVPEVPAVLPPALAVPQGPSNSSDREERVRAAEARRAEREAKARASEARRAERHARAARLAAREAHAEVAAAAGATAGASNGASVVSASNPAPLPSLPPAIHSIEVSGPARVEIEVGTDGTTIRVVPL